MVPTCRMRAASPTTPGAILTSTCVRANIIPVPTTSFPWDRTDVKEPMMTLPTGNNRTRNSERRHAQAFTLIELTLVMALLLIVFGVALPSLKGFFRGRSLDSEARRFLSLTRYGQSRAVSEGVPMVLWIDTRRVADALQQQAGYTDGDSNAVRFALSEQRGGGIKTPVPPLQAGRLTGRVPGAGWVLRLGL